MSNPTSNNNNITTIPESPPPPPPPLPTLLRHHHHHHPQSQLVASNKYTTPSRLLVAAAAAAASTNKSPIPPAAEARQDASSSYELKTPPQEHRSLVSKDDASFNKNNDHGEATTNNVASLRQSLSWSSPPPKTTNPDKLDTASPVNGWPQRSPMMNPQHHHDASSTADVASFALFTQSFDTISESGQQQQLQQQHQHFGVEEAGLPHKIHLKARSSSSGSGRIQEDAASVGNLSPIRLGPEEGIARPTNTAGGPSAPYSHPYPRHFPPSDPYRGNTPPPPPYHHPEHHGPPPYYRHHHHHQYDHNGPPPPPPYEESGYGYPPPPPPEQRGPRGHTDANDNGGDEMHHRSNPFFVLRTAHRAFWGCSYLLPCLENREVIPIHLGVNPSIRLLQDPASIPEAAQVAIAKRRVETAICTFGGYLPMQQQQQQQHSHAPQDSIFRRRGPDAAPKPGWKQAYDDGLEGRYVVKSNHIEWNLEENPPIGDSLGMQNRYSSNTKPNGNLETELVQENNTLGSTVSVVTLENNQQKMKYRCKLCGQLKQNHNCPYQQSLQRSIGIMVYPAANAYTASEPGQLTKPLSEMNNFVSYDESSADDHQWMRPHHMPYNVTPETKSREHVHSPSSLTTVDSMVVDGDGNPPFSSRRKRRDNKKPLAKTLTLRQEHYRAVTPMASEDGFEYQYPHVPLTFQERKRLSDTLFYLSKEIPDTTAPVASLLRTARERNEWDLCVAELLTQIVVALYCREGDHRLEGLQDYLLRLGVTC